MQEVPKVRSSSPMLAHLGRLHFHHELCGQRQFSKGNKILLVKVEHSMEVDLLGLISTLALIAKMIAVVWS